MLHGMQGPQHLPRAAGAHHTAEETYKLIRIILGFHSGLSSSPSLATKHSPLPTRSAPVSALASVCTRPQVVCSVRPNLSQSKRDLTSSRATGGATCFCPGCFSTRLDLVTAEQSCPWSAGHECPAAAKMTGLGCRLGDSLPSQARRSSTDGQGGAQEGHGRQQASPSPLQASA